MASNTGMQKAVETSVPTLKVMRLQKPELHMVRTRWRSSYDNPSVKILSKDFFLSKAGGRYTRGELLAVFRDVSSRFVRRYVFNCCYAV